MLKQPSNATTKGGVQSEPVSKPPSTFAQKVGNVVKNVATGTALVAGAAALGATAYGGYQAYKYVKPFVEAGSTVKQVAQGTYNPPKLATSNNLPKREADWTDKLTNVLLPGRVPTSVSGGLSKPSQTAGKPVKSNVVVPSVVKGPTVPGGLPGGWN